MQTNKPAALLNQFNATIDKWIIYLNDYTIEMLCRKPAPGAWSLGQVYIHIIDDTTFFIEQIETCLLSNANSECEMHADAKTMFANNAFPNVLLTNPANSLNLLQPQNKGELLHSLMRIKDEVNYLYNAYNFAEATGKTRHPGLLYFNAMQWLQFAEMHLRHHLRQKKRIDDVLLST
jgi:hypothetical protein